MLVHSNWLEDAPDLATYLAVVAVLFLGWPFVALLFVPLALHIFYTQFKEDKVTGIIRVLVWGVGSLMVIFPTVLAIDYYFYKRLAFTALNILLYNVIGGSDGKGDTLYGVEPASYYIINLFLNLSLVFPLVLVSLPVNAIVYVFVRGYRRRILEELLFVSPAFLWLLVMFLRPHKEERFLYPIYPLLCLCAAFSLENIEGLLQLIFSASSQIVSGRHREPIKRSFKRVSFVASVLFRMILYGIFMTYVAMFVSRSFSMYRNYRAPLTLYQHLYSTHLVPARSSDYRVCVGGEWYRFPTSFFLPGKQNTLYFIKSSFGGQLPQPFRPVNGTWDAPLLPFNELNQEEPSRYVPLDSCTYYIEFFPRGADEESVAEAIKKSGGIPEKWEVLNTWPFIDTERSRSPYRSFYIPGLTEKHTKFGDYALLAKT